MAIHNSNTKMNAKKLAARFRKKGYRCSVFKKQGGFGISVTYKKKK